MSATYGTTPSLPPGREPGGAVVTLRNGNRRGDPNAAPRCGAKARTTGCACRAPAMANGRCRLHGGKSTGPRTADGLARMAAAHTRHGRYGVASVAARAVERAHWRRHRYALERSNLLSAATELMAFLPPEMAMRLDLDARELFPSPRPDWGGCVGEAGSTPCNERRGGAGGGAMAGRSPGQAPGDKGPAMTVNAGTGRARTGISGRASPLLVGWRAVERAEAQAEAEMRTPWKEAIAIARARKRAQVEERRRRVRWARAERAEARALRIDRMQREAEIRAAVARGWDGDPTTWAAAKQRPETGAPVSDIDLMYREIAFRAAGLRGPRQARSDAVPRETEPLAPTQAASTLGHAPQALSDGKATGVGGVTRIEPMQPDKG